MTEGPEHDQPLAPQPAAPAGVSRATPAYGVARGVEFRVLVDEWSGQHQTFPAEPSLAAQFAARAALSPDAIALTFDGEALSYHELNRRANQVAHFLRLQGISEGSLVGLLMERGIDLLVGLLGIVKAGAAYLPMDLAYPADRLRHMASDAGATIILSSTEASAQFELPGVRIIRLDADRSEISRYADSNPEIALTAESLAYVIYTSGSTGAPKGCQVTHGNVVRLFASCHEMFAFSSEDVWTLFHSHAFDFSVWEMWGAWLHGGRLVVVPQVVSRSPALFLDLLAAERVTFLNQTPSAFKQLTTVAAARAETLPLSLRRIVFGGEVLELEALRPWIDRYGDTSPQLVNGYGITETTVFVTFHRVRASDLDRGTSAPIGKPMPDLTCFVLDQDRHVAAIGTPGELYVGGAGVTRGYLNRDDLTAQRFVDWSPTPGVPTSRYYRSGDLVRWLPSGVLEFLGRIDQQVKIRGFRIELGEVESVLAKCAGVAECAVVARADTLIEPRLVGYVVPRGEMPSHTAIREFMKGALPDYMIPSAFVAVDALPLTANGKLDQRALPAPEQARPELSAPYMAPVGDLESACCAAYAQTLQLDRVGRDDNFFELGGTSLLAVQAADRIEQLLGRRVSAAALFANASPASLSAYLSPTRAAEKPRDENPLDASGAGSAAEPIALIALASRLPGAESTEEFWANLLAERDALTLFSAGDLDASIPEELRRDSAYVSARSVLRDPAGFDPAFFGLSQREAEIMDPQQRLLLELSWECLERAGYAPDRTADRGHTVGVFAGVYSAEYLRKNVLVHPAVVSRVGEFAAMLATDKDYVATRIAHRLNLTGPAVSVHTACSTALVAIVQAFDSLRAGRCSMAIAGGASMTYPPQSGYLYQEGAMLSKDGVTRTFDASATGTVFGDGGALVLMKRLSDALADGDPIYAVIRGAGINNDGGAKASFTAPSAEGQTKVIAAAHRDAGVKARSISYVEAHGTATPLGDPIEIEGLTRAFRDGERGTSATGFCRIGSAKSNVGHIVAAAGAVGVIKTALSLAHESLPATLHFKAPNPQIDFANSPFIVNGERTAWPRGDAPRRAGVSAFGVGGTNAHVVLEEAPERVESPAVTGAHILRLSARTKTALHASALALARQLREQPDANLADVAFTLNEGRTPFAQRLCVIASDVSSAANALEHPDHALRATRVVPPQQPRVIMTFPGQGAQYPRMGAELYAADAVFRDACDEAFRALAGTERHDLKQQLFSADDDALNSTDVTQPATFCVEYALAKLWLSRGVSPAVMIGHSIGEFVAAVLSGVMSLGDAARLVAMRGALMTTMPRGSMLSVRQSPETVLARLPATLSMAAVNGPTACVVAGPEDAVAEFAAELERDGVVARALQTSHAFHSSMMDDVLQPFADVCRTVTLSAPRIPIVSTLTGDWLTDQQATDPMYWVHHLRQPVRFNDAVRVALSGTPALFLEVGPRHGLSTLVRQHASPWPDERVPVTVASLTDGPMNEGEAIALAVGQLWLSGIDADLPATMRRRRVLLPSYQFDRVRCWLDALPATISGAHDTTAATVAHMLSAPALQTAAPIPATDSASTVGASDRRSALITRLRAVFEDVGGMELDDADPSLSFVELGLDSLVLTQAAIQVKKTFAVPVTFRQLMEQYRSLDALAEHLDGLLPPDAVAVPVAPPTASSHSMPMALPAVSGPAASGDESFAQQVIRQQLVIMQQQLAVLSGNSAVVAAAPTVAVSGAAQASAQPRTAPASVTASESADEAKTLAHTTYDVKKAFGAIARIHTRPSSELSERQTQRLQTFMQRYAARTRASKSYTEAHRAHLADPRVVNGFRPQTKEICYQIVMAKSKGARMWDLDGHEYIDALNGFGMSLFGWQPEFVNAAVHTQVDLGHDIGPQNPLAGEVAALICEMTGFDRAGLCNTGSEAVMGAIRIARTVTARNLIVSFSGSYHGIFDEVLVRGTKKLRAVPAAPGILQAAVENVLVLDYGTPESLEIIRSRAHELAAVLVEPVQSRRPEFQPVEFLRELRNITQDSGTILIFDEVITGFRAHQAGVQGLFGIRADLATYGKVIGGGYPIGVIAGKREFMDALDGGSWQFGDDSIPTVGVTYFAGTFVRHPLALAACKAALTHLKEQGPALQVTLTNTTSAMANEMNAFARSSGAPVEIRHFASLWRIAFTEEHPLQDLLWAMMRLRGIHILDNFPCFVTTAHSDADIAAIVQAFKGALIEMQDAGFLPGAGSDTVVEADANAPPVPNARLGRDRDGTPAWFVPDPQSPGQYLKVLA
jgi:amino acid adenylation domain-containing protein